jgi:threonine/homoserine/homoserine lactone efflux protein
MTLTGLLIFSAAYALAIASPGPGVATVVAQVLALLPAIVDLENLTVAGFGEVALVIVVTLPAVLSAYALFAHLARGMFRSERALRNLNRLSGTALLALPWLLPPAPEPAMLRT